MTLLPTPTEPTIAGMNKPSAIEVRVTPNSESFLGRHARILKPGARYVVRRKGDEHEGRWLPDGEATPAGYGDTFTEAEARLLLPFLRARGAAGRVSREATTPDGKLVVRAKRALGLTAAGLGEAIGAHESVLSRALHGSLPDAHREAIRALLKSKKPKRPPRTR